MNIRKLSNGKIQATVRVGWEQTRQAENDFNANHYSVRSWADERASLYDALTADEMPVIYGRDGYSGFDQRMITVGDEGCLAMVSDVSPNALRCGASDDSTLYLKCDARGIPGNSNPAIYRLHGWRGTSNDLRVDADGWRRVECIERLKRGIGFRVIFSADMRADQD